MLAFTLGPAAYDGPHDRPRSTDPDSERCGRSLALFAPQQLRSHRAGAATYHILAAADRGALTQRSWRPFTASSGAIVLFHGWLDNADELARTLRCEATGVEALYAAAVDKWGDDADRHVVGEYCAVIHRPVPGDVRLSRSAIAGPPLHYHRGPHGLIAASVPRAIIAAGVPADLDDDKLALTLTGVPLRTAGGWYRAIRQVQMGETVTLSREGERVRRYYDFTAIPRVGLARDADYVEAARALLHDGIDAALAGGVRPGMMMSGGLDSTLVASHVLDRMAPGGSLPTYTWLTQGEGEWRVGKGLYADEKPLVEAFARHEPRIRPRFFDNDGVWSDQQLDRLFLAMGTCPIPSATTYASFALYDAARSDGCDVMLNAGMGNDTISFAGGTGLFEFARNGQWTALWRALQAQDSPHSVARRFLWLLAGAAMPRRWFDRRVARGRKGQPDYIDLAGALNPRWPGAGDLVNRLRRDETLLTRPYFRSRAERLERCERMFDADAGEFEQGMAQIYGVRTRDPTRYRPLVEFCLGIPTTQFLRGGENRFLARRLAEGRLPEAIRSNRLFGAHRADWQGRVAGKRAQLRTELATMAQDPRVAALVDFDRLRALVADLPDRADAPVEDDAFPWQIALPLGYAMGRFIQHTEGRNAVRCPEAA